MIPNNITKEHLIKAILEIDEKGIRKGRHSSTYDIEYNGNLYPPKLVISIANRFANGVELDPNSFAGGKGTDAFKLLDKKGFIVNKKISILNLKEIQNGIELLCKTSSEVDGYYQNDENIVKGLNNATIDDLKKCAEYYSSRNGVVIDIRKELINRLIKKEVFTVKSLTELIEKYKKGNEKKFRSYKKTFSIVFPAITFYGHNEQRNFVESFTSKLIDDLSLRKNVKEVSFDFQGVRQQGSDFYWVAIYNREQKNQSTGNQFFFEFHKGKIGYSFYRHSDKSYLKPKVTLKPEDFNYEKMLLYFNESKDLLLEDIPNNKENGFYDTITDFIEQSKTNNLKTNSYTKKYKGLKTKVSFGQGNAAKIPWIALLDEPNKVSNGIYPVYLYYKDSNILILAYGISETNIPAIVWDIEKPISITNYFYKNGLGTPKRYGTSYIKAVYNLNDDLESEMIEKDLNEIIEEYKNLNIENSVNETELDYKKEKMNLPLNTILYGPPGTGKTYKLKNEFFDMFTDERSTQTKEDFLIGLVDNLSWWETLGIVLLDLKKAKVNEILEHPFTKAKVGLSNSKSIRATLWGQMQVHTIEECQYVNVKDRRAPFIFNKSQNSQWEIVESNVKNDVPELIDILFSYNNFKSSIKTKKRYVFTTFHQSFSYEDFIEGIKPIIHEDESNPEIGKQVIYDIKSGLFKQIVKEAKADKDNDYAIFIDEINRGNIANIFGELITLIEDDKRIGKENYIPAKLPYSNEDFGVPPNLYIVGTMNTADRSVEALDTALRRRFSFIEMNPEPNKLSTEEFKCEGIDLEALLFAINSRIEKLLDKDYCIGHSYFMTIKNREEPLGEIKTIFQNKILPLLQEYFYGDWGKIMLVIGKEFIYKRVETIKFLANGLADEYEEYDEKPIYNFTDSTEWTIESFKSIYE